MVLVLRVGNAKLCSTSPALPGASGHLIYCNVAPVVLLFKEQRLFAQFRFSCHVNKSEKFLPIMVVEFFNYTIAPWLTFWDKPGFDTIVQAKADQYAHPARCEGCHKTASQLGDAQACPTVSKWPKRHQRCAARLVQ